MEDISGFIRLIVYIYRFNGKAQLIE